MAQTTQQELNYIKSELRSIIAQIKTISDSLKTNQGIGVEKCSENLNNISRQYQMYLSQLEQINFEKESPPGSSGGGIRF